MFSETFLSIDDKGDELRVEEYSSQLTAALFSLKKKSAELFLLIFQKKMS